MYKDTDITMSIQKLLCGQRPVASMLLVAPLHLDILNAVKQASTVAFCEKKTGCQSCANCMLLQHGHHPDLYLIEPEDASSSIKIDRIREIQQHIYQTPKRGLRKIVILNQAEKMNISASNALLKVLEEPPAHATFVLITEQVNSVLPTIRSRCQKLTFSESTSLCFNHLASLYGKDSTRGVLCESADDMCRQIEQLLLEKVTPCDLASLWEKHDIDDLMWWFGLLIRVLVSEKLNPNESNFQDKEPYHSLVKSIHPTQLFHINDMICVIRKKISHNITMNKQLVIEDILINLMESTHVRND